MNSLVRRTAALTLRPAFNKIEYRDGNNYNVRWGHKWSKAYYTYLRDGPEHEYVRKPEDSKNVNPLFWSWVQDWLYRGMPWFRMFGARSHRLQDKFNRFVLPATFLTLFQFYDFSVGFKVLTFMPLMMFYIRARDRVLDPDIKETYLREVVFEHPDIKPIFNHDHTIVLDYDCEYDKGFLDGKVWPEFENKLFRFFNSDGHTATGHFVFADVNTNARMHLRFKTMPIYGKYRYQVGQPFYFYDMRAEITHEGQTRQVVIVDEAQSRKKIHPFLIML